MKQVEGEWIIEREMMMISKDGTMDVPTKGSWHAIPNNMMEKEAASSFVNKALTWWNTQVQARGHEAAICMSCADFNAFLVEEFCPSTEMEKLEFEYLIEVANGKKVEVARVIHNCKLELGTYLFTIDLIPLGHGSFNLIVGMDWLSEHKAKIVFYKKVVRIPLESGEILYVQGERTSRIN
nr:putative reverse transcriptase domain, ribonuclease H-like domain, aspartic peptidase domain protein [Tanacetum cinerariifolium]